MASGAEGNRTLDLLNAIQALSQLSYGPTGGTDERNPLYSPPPTDGQRNADHLDVRLTRAGARRRSARPSVARATASRRPARGSGAGRPASRSRGPRSGG